MSSRAPSRGEGQAELDIPRIAPELTVETIIKNMSVAHRCQNHYFHLAVGWE